MNKPAKKKIDTPVQEAWEKELFDLFIEIHNHGWHCFKNHDHFDYRQQYFDEKIDSVHKILAHQRKELLKSIKRWANKEFEERKAEFIKSGDELKASHAGYAYGVIARMLTFLEKIEGES